MRLVVLDRAGHRPAHGLRILGRQVARDREHRLVARRIHDRQLPAFQRVGAVREYLVDHFGHRHAAREEHPLLAVTREHHVVARQRHRGRDRGRLFARAFHVETGLALALCAHHSRIERAGQRHQAQHADQRCGIERRIPRAVRTVIIAQHPHHIEAQGMRVDRRARLVGSRLCACRRDRQTAVIDDVARPVARLGHMQRQLWQIAFGHADPAPEVSTSRLACD